MPGISLPCSDALYRALEETAALRGISIENAALEILARSLDVRETRHSRFPTIPAAPLTEGESDEALELAIRETSAFLEGG